MSDQTDRMVREELMRLRRIVREQKAEINDLCAELAAVSRERIEEHTFDAGRPTEVIPVGGIGYAWPDDQQEG